MKHSREIDFTVRAECEREGLDPRRFVRVLDHLATTSSLEEALGLVEPGGTRAAAIEEAYEHGQADERDLAIKRIRDARRTLSHLGQTKDVRGLIQSALYELIMTFDDEGDELVDTFLEAIDELVEAAAPNA